MPELSSEVLNSLSFTDGNTLESEHELDKRKTKPQAMTAVEQALLRRIRQRRDDMLEAQTPYHEEWDDAEEAVENPLSTDPNEEKISLGISSMVIDAMIAEEMDAFPDITITAAENEDRKLLNTLTPAKDNALKALNWDRVKNQTIRTSATYGIAPVKIGFRREFRILNQRVPEVGDNGVALKDKEIIDFYHDDIYAEVIRNPRRFLVDDNALEISDAEDCMLMTELNWNAFRQQVQHDKRFKNLDLVSPAVSGSNGTGTSVLNIQVDTKVSKTSKIVTLEEYWNKLTDEYIVIANDIIIYVGHLPDDHKELPFAVMKLYRRPNSFYAKGVPKLIESIEETMNALVKAKIRATKLAFPILATEDDGIPNTQASKSYPGVTMVGFKGKVELMQLGSVPAEVYKSEEKLEDYIIYKTGVNYKQVYDAGSGKVGIEALKKESMLARINMYLRENEADFVIRFGDLLMQLIQQYYPVPRLRRITGNDDLSGIKDEDKIVTPEGRMGIVEMRKIPLAKGMMAEESGTEGKRILRTSNKGNPYFFARPEYIRTKSRLDIRAVRPSAMGSSKEAKKLVLQEFLNTATTVNQAEFSMQRPPVFNMKFLGGELALASDMPKEEVILEDNPIEPTAADVVSDLEAKLTPQPQPMEPEMIPAQ